MTDELLAEFYKHYPKIFFEKYYDCQITSLQAIKLRCKSWLFVHSKLYKRYCFLDSFQCDFWKMYSLACGFEDGRNKN